MTEAKLTIGYIARAGAQASGPWVRIPPAPIACDRKSQIIPAI